MCRVTDNTHRWKPPYINIIYIYIYIYIYTPNPLVVGDATSTVHQIFLRIRHCHCRRRRDMDVEYYPPSFSSLRLCTNGSFLLTFFFGMCISVYIYTYISLSVARHASPTF